MNDEALRWTRFLFLRALGLVWTVAFAVAAIQNGPLIGSNGLTPAAAWLARVEAARGSGWPSVSVAPTLLWIDASDGALAALAWAGVAGAAALMLGVSNAALVAVLWTLYLSLCNAGQVWYGYGWEILLLEAGFLAIWLCPLRGWRPLAPPPPGTAAVFVLYRWLAFRLMLGAGLIKLRGDPCWTELTCLAHHYETQPVPSPLSWWLHQRGADFHALGALVNHGVELVAPWFCFGPKTARRLAGLSMMIFQGLLILSGNLSFLNWLAAAVCLTLLDDGWTARWVPARLRQAAIPAQDAPVWRRARLLAVGLLVAVVAGRSVAPALNLMDSAQAMNGSYDPLHLVNTYGAFGDVSEARVEAVVQGTLSEHPGEADWQDFEFPCKPGDPGRRPCLITPWHWRLDWQLWFVPLAPALEEHPWVAHLAWKLLDGDPGVRTLLARDPFEGRAPRQVRVLLYDYRFTAPGEAGWWVRRPSGVFLRAVSREDSALRAFLALHGWGPEAR